MLEPRPYELSVTAWDGTSGNPTTERSGTKNVALYVDNQFETTLYGDRCPSGNCSPTRQWTFDPDRYEDGPHVVRVEAVDELDQRAVRELRFSTPKGVLIEDKDEDAERIDDEPPTAPYGADEDADENASTPCEADPEVPGDIECSSTAVDAHPAEPPLRTGASFPLKTFLTPSADLESGGSGWGLADQDARVFGLQAFRELGVRRVRLLVAWDAVRRSDGTDETPNDDSSIASYTCINRDTGNPIPVPVPESNDLQEAMKYVKDAREAGLEVMVTINRSRHGGAYCYLPTVEEYKEWVAYLMQKLPEVKVWGSWNEPNDAGQPTSLIKNPVRGPKRAAQYYRAMGSICSGCMRGTAEFVDRDTVLRKVTDRGRRNPCKPSVPNPPSDCRSYFARYIDGLKGAKPRYWGWHAYEAGTERDGARLRAFIRRVEDLGRDNVEFWLTEQGGRAQLPNPSGPHGFQGPDSPSTHPESDQDALGDAMYILGLPDIDDRITRFYYYEWAGAYPKEDPRPETEGEPPLFDSGLTDFTHASTPLIRADGNLDGPLRSIYCAFIVKTRSPAPACTPGRETTNADYDPQRATDG